MPEDMPRERRVETTGESMNSSEITATFSAIDLTPIKLNELCTYFKEFKALSTGCKFRGCQHLHEPKCAVKDQLVLGEIATFRYDDYLAMRTEIEEGRMPEYLK